MDCRLDVALAFVVEAFVGVVVVVAVWLMNGVGAVVWLAEVVAVGTDAEGFMVELTTGLDDVVAFGAVAEFKGDCEVALVLDIVAVRVVGGVVWFPPAVVTAWVVKFVDVMFELEEVVWLAVGGVVVEVNTVTFDAVVEGG